MRIRGSGSRSSNSGGNNDNRSNSFRKGRQPGQIVHGTLIKWVSKDMAWVQIDGQKLLAQLKSSPSVGQKLTFTIKQLLPEIILKEVFESSSAGGAVIGMASNFDTARILFENQFKSYVKDLISTHPSKRQGTFITHLCNDSKLRTLYQDTLACLSAVNTHSQAHQRGYVFYQPWLIPEARRQISLLSPKATIDSQLTQVISEFELDALGMVRAEFLHTKGLTGYRLKVQHMAKSLTLKSYLESQHNDFSSTLECLGISKLPQRLHGGILAELMFLQ